MQDEISQCYADKDFHRMFSTSLQLDPMSHRSNPVWGAATDNRWRMGSSASVTSTYGVAACTSEMEISREPVPLPTHQTGSTLVPVLDSAKGK